MENENKLNFDEISQDPYYRKILNTLKFPFKVSPDELENLKLIALWKAINTYIPSKSAFNTHLTNFIKYVKLDHIKQEAKFYLKSVNLTRKNIPISLTEEDFGLMSELLTEKEYEVGKMYYVDKMTDAEIKKKLKMSSRQISYIRKKIKKKCSENFL